MFSPIKVKGDQFTFAPRRMKREKFYHFVWEGIDYFAMSKNKRDVVFFALTPGEHISGINVDHWNINGELA